MFTLLVSVDLTFAQIEIEDGGFNVDRNELLTSVPNLTNFSNCILMVLTNFDVHWNHETTVRSQTEILMSFTSNVSRTAQKNLHA